MLRRLARRLTREPRPYQVAFVVSAPRSGSTWLRTALSHHPEVLCTENRLFGDFFEVWNDPHGSAPRMTLDYYAGYLADVQNGQAMGLRRDVLVHELVQRLADQTFSLLSELTGKCMIVDKVTPYLGTSEAVLEGIERYFPEAPTVQLVRDGRDVATSGIFDWLLKDGEGSDRHALFVERRAEMTLKRFFDEQTLTRWIRYWVEPIRAFERHARSSPMIRYEEMKGDQAVVLRDFFSRLALDTSDAVVNACVEGARFEVMSGGRSAGTASPTAKVRRGVSGDWRNYFTRADGELFARLAGRELCALGYEKDDTWVDELPAELHLVAPE